MPPIKSRRQNSSRKRTVETEQDDTSGYKKWILAVLLVLFYVVYVINASFVAKHIDQWQVFGIYMLSFLCFAVYVL